MKTKVLILLLSIYLSFNFNNNLHSQISKGGIPESFSCDNLDNEIPEHTMNSFNIEKMLLEDEQNNKNGTSPYRFAKSFDVDYSTDNSGVWDILPSGDKIWRIAITSEGAYSLNFIFGKYYLPEGAKLFIYNRDKSEILGAFTSENNKKSKVLPTSLLPGDYAVIEYFEPYNAEFNGELQVSKVNHDYRGIGLKQKDLAFGSAGNCNVDINCPLGDNWQYEKHSVCRIIIGGNSFCTGTLLNNTSQDGTPYFLTANHCTAESYDTWTFYFNYESPTCEGIDGSISQTIASCELKATTTALDFCLVELSSTPPESYLPYYAGWNNSETSALSSVSIHHPSGDVKKISVDYEEPIIGNWGPIYDTNSHWLIQQWDENTTTEGGSSGGPLFDQSHRVIGDLTGGEADCGNSINDYYTMFHRSWDDYSDINQQLKHWLDPLNSGVEVINGYDPYIPIEIYPIITGKASYSGGFVEEHQGVAKLYNNTHALTAIDTIDADNNFKFNDLDYGDYYVKVEILDTTALPNVISTYYNNSVTWSNAQLISVNESDSINSIIIEMTELPNEPGIGVISGLTEYAETLKSTYTTIAAVGSEIFLVDNSSNIINYTTSNSEGMFQISTIPNGDYSLLVNIPGYTQISTHNFTIDETNYLFQDLNFSVDTTNHTIEASNSSNIKEIKHLKFNIYPNPVNDILTINISQKLNSSINIYIIDALGKTIKETQISADIESFNLSVVDINSGTYLLKIVSGDDVFIKKITVVK